ncbi:programmed cell death 1 ligand 1-like [Haplochromis burtoni]|uniref:programmed cell death 1 ligand 1-like n=1 Tax=Haplochromis burtoni TaxID=8153 RepID=UPI001C2D5FCF|nr:programmed cell death 1 ligand 1-like [Haplochromis burtoni]
MRLEWTSRLCFLILHFVFADQETISAQSGQNVTLTCQASNNTIPVVEWKRADLGEYVISYRDEQSDPEEQHPTFKNRVDLQDREMKAGDVSLILKDVTVNDAGTYECRVAQKSGESMGLLCNITLSVVDPPGQTGGDTEDGGKEEREGGWICWTKSWSSSCCCCCCCYFCWCRDLQKM